LYFELIQKFKMSIKNKPDILNSNLGYGTDTYLKKVKKGGEQWISSI